MFNFMKPTADRWPYLPKQLRAARRLLVSMLLVCILLAGGMTANYFIRSMDQFDAAGAWMRRLDLSMPVLWPAGTLLRAPESASSAVLPRLTPRDIDPWDETRIALLWQRCPGPKVTP